MDRTDQAVADMTLQSGTPLSAEQAALLRERLGADLVVGGTVQDYGKVRWQWLAAGMVGDMTWESLAIGAATSWNPAVIFGNIGFELLTSTPVWFGGGYLFGVAFSPVRVDAWAVETQRGTEVWGSEAIAVYVWRRLKTVPEEDRKKKEVTLRLNTGMTFVSIVIAINLSFYFKMLPLTMTWPWHSSLVRLSKGGVMLCRISGTRD
ncbi:MAG: hypothetical protein HZB35_06555 [Nitrospirae bacterium]|nr:hypothetical protein [Nitrospirota bacterium]